MFKPSARELAFVKGGDKRAGKMTGAIAAENPEAEIVDEDDYDVFDPPAPIVSRWKAWLALAGGIVAAGLLAWAVTFLDPPPESQSARPLPIATLGAMTPAPVAKPSPTVVFDSAVPIVPRALLTTIVEPEALGGRARSSEGKPEPDSYMKTFTDGKLIWGAYGEPETNNFVWMSAVTSTHLQYPDTQIDVLLNHLQTEDPNLTVLQPVPAGSLGGLATCGSSRFAETPTAVCVWVGEQSMGMITWIGMPVAQAKEELLVLRAQIEMPVVG